ncbi:MAG: SulP family inorganic anion transporter [Chromatiales bacterium]
MNPVLQSIFPFLRWFPLRAEGLRGDLTAGVTVALILVPQSMAYAQLAGLPVVYGLYASFVPVIVASLWGSSSQLHTGPVAMLSLMSAAALIPFATPGSPGFIELSIMLALMVGVLRMALGLFRLGVIVNFLSSPVIIGFTNAAALIIGLSQLSKIMGVPFPRSDFYLADLWNVVRQIPEAHWPTLLFALAAWLIMQYGGRVSRKLPAVLIAVVITTLASWALGFEQKTTVPLERVEAPAFVESVTRYAEQRGRIDELTSRLSELGTELRESQRLHTAEAMVSIANDKAQIALLSQQLRELKQINNALRIKLHAQRLAIEDVQGVARFVPLDAATDSTPWRFAGISDGEITLSAGGAVVGTIPEGLPKLQAPTLQWDLMLALLPAALVMALIGFMEATSISKAIATSTGERVDTSKELVGQGLANIAGSFFGSYTVSGSFSRSAVAARTGATTGLFAIISALGVMLVLLFFTPYLYHLPQAVLAVIVMTAVFGLIRTKPLWHAFRVEWPEAAIGVTTFCATLIMAPSLASGILLGVALTVLWYLIQIMRPRAEIVARKTDGTLGGIRAHQLQPISKAFVPVRFDGSLSFINVAYFEDILLEAHADFPRAEAILIIGSGVNQIDVSGEEKIRELTLRLKEVGVTLMFSGLKHQVMKVFERGGLIELIGRENFFSDKETALHVLTERYGVNSVAAEPKPA